MKLSLPIAQCCLLVLLWACSFETETPEKQQEEDLFKVELDFEKDAVVDLICRRIKIDPTDIGTFEMHRAHLNADADEDGYVVMNLAPRALRDMEKSSNPARFKDMGYIGDYNFIYVWNGKTRTLGTAFKLSGNGLIPLKVTASNFLDPGFLALSAEYRVQNSTFETFFRNINGQLIPVFSYAKVDGIGTPEMQVTTHRFEENPSNIEKDIVIVKGLLTNYNETEAATNRNSYDVGKILPTDSIVYRFFYDESSKKYATFAKPE